MTEKLVKKKSEIFQEIADSKTANEGDEIAKELVLILPESLDKMEEMLKEEIDKRRYPKWSEASFKNDIDLVFARFKKEQGIQ